MTDGTDRSTSYKNRFPDTIGRWEFGAVSESFDFENSRKNVSDPSPEVVETYWVVGRIPISTVNLSQRSNSTTHSPSFDLCGDAASVEFGRFRTRMGREDRSLHTRFTPSSRTTDEDITMADESNKVHHSDLVIDEIREDPSGRDDRHLEQEYVTFRNDGASELDISGWSVEDEGGNTFTFPEETILDEGDRVTLHSGDGTNTDSDCYWGSDRPMWRNAGDTIFVRDSDGGLRIRESYNE